MNEEMKEDIAVDRKDEKINCKPTYHKQKQ